MASFNKIIIVGYLGRDPELKYSPQGTAVCKFSVATTERRKNANSETEELTTWFRVTAFGAVADFIGTRLVKGNQVYIEGRLRAEEWTDREGQRRTSLEVAASSVYSLSKLSEAEAVGEGANESKPAKAKAARAGIDKEASRAALNAQAPFDDDDIPF